MIYKLVSIKRVIAKVMDEMDLQEGNHNISNMIELAGSALEKIGAFPYFVYKITGKDGEPSLSFTNYQSRLPNGLHKVITVGYSSNEGGPFYPMRYATGTLSHSSQLNTDMGLGSSVPSSSDSELVTLAMSLYTYVDSYNNTVPLTYPMALAKINAEPGTRALLESLLGTSSAPGGVGHTDTTDLTYVIHDGYIKTNVDSGYLTIAYQAIPTDLDGYPLIPDDTGFIDAVYWYIVMKILYPMWRDGRVRDAVYYDAKSSWNFYCKQAYGNAMMPSLDQLRSIKNSWLRLIPDIHEGDNFFATLGQQETVYNQN